MKLLLKPLSFAEIHQVSGNGNTASSPVRQDGPWTISQTPIGNNCTLIDNYPFSISFACLAQ